jgi:ABC-type nickel/cobalt efflux system permease component RcnA
MIKIIISFFLWGLLFGSGPCVASCGPILISYIAGTKKNITKGLLVYILFSSARISVYLILSLLIFFLGRFALERLWGGFSRYTLILGGIFIILVGILMTLGKRLEFKSWQFLQRNILEHDKKSIVIIGLTAGLAPCAPFLAILSYIGLISKSWLHSLSYAFAFGLGTLMSPLILLTVLSGLVSHWLQDKNYYKIFSFICGLVIIFLGIQLIIKVF